MQLEYTITPEDYMQATGLWMRNASSRPQISYWLCSWPGIVVGVLAVVLAIPVASSSLFRAQDNMAAIILWIVLVCFLLTLPIRYRRVVKKRYDMQRMAATIRVEMNETGVEIIRTSGDADVRYRWQAFVKQLESESLYLLFPTEMSFVIIPKRALTPDQQTELRDLLAAHIPSK